MEKENMYGKMVDDIKVNTKMIKNKGLENINGRMGKFMKDNGKMENSTVKEKLFKQMVT